MARLARVEYEGAIYHVTVRGNQRQAIFRDDRDRERFLEKLGEYAELYAVRIYAFCLMTNHVHLVVETARPNLGRFMHRLQTAYTVFYNMRHRQVGHLMQGRYKAKPVEGDVYLLKLMRYVHLNPVFTAAEKAKTTPERVADLRAYRWSSYPCYLGRCAWEYVCVRPLLALMAGSTVLRQRAEMRRFVESAIAEPDEEFKEALRASPFCLGGASFRDHLQGLYAAANRKAVKPEDVVLRTMGRNVPVPRVLAVVCGVLRVEEAALRVRSRGTWLRPVLAEALARHAGLTQRAIAALMGLRTGKAVSLQLARLPAALARNRTMARRVVAIHEVLKKEAKF